ncbi:histidine kinase [Stenotrophomonas rhizophila]|uniref:sensor histidine kinase n=1 Tax=Stenotrophomonas rhizophila TaxID=216778 RepID=UPI000FA84682|nr:histidine kinase [Stenotrophomonas rhizophila]ROP79048.1 histidine kinase [Stenotrophomonas rhizophila]
MSEKRAARDSGFWWRNSAVWLAYLGVSLLLGFTYGGHWSGIVLISAMVSLSLWVGSAFIRGYALRHDWLQRDLLGLTWRLLLAVVIVAAAAQVLTAAALLPALAWDWVQLPGQRANYRPAAVFGYWFNTAIVLSVWCALWTGRRALQRARHSEMAQLRAEAQRATLEHQALRARLNPHFVFNALNNLRALINEDPARARDMVTHLSSTLRHALVHTDGGWVTLAEEWRVVQDYLAVEAIHYEDRLRVHTDIDPVALSARLPPMALQLLVENAIKHGIAVHPGGGELTIRVRLDGGWLRVEVDNPAVHDASSEGHGIGLAYLRAQLGIDTPPSSSSRGTFRLERQGERMLARLEVQQ